MVAPGFGPSEVRKWVAQVACALQYMHGLHVLHRDLSTKNIFLSQSRYATEVRVRVRVRVRVPLAKPVCHRG